MPRDRSLVFSLALLLFGLTPSVHAQPAAPAAAAANDEAALQARLDALVGANKLAEARSVAEALLQLRERKLGPKHAKVGDLLSLLALLHAGEKDWSKARDAQLRALAVIEVAHGRESAQAAESHRRTSGVYVQLRDYERALTHAERALQLFEKNRGETDVLASLRLHIRGLLLQIGRDHLLAGKLDLAMPYQRRALELGLREKEGVTPRELAILHGDLAVTTERAGQRKGAIVLYRRAAELYEAASDEANLLENLNRAAILLGDEGKYREAVPLFERALELEQKLHGPESSRGATISSNLALVSANAGDYSKAEGLYLKALAWFERERKDDPEVARVLANLAGLYDELDQRRRALPLYERALAIREKHGDPVSLALAVQDLALAQQKLGELALAQRGYARAYRLLEESGATESEDGAQILSNWASAYADQGEFARAEELGQKALALLDKLFGKDAPNTAHAANNLGDYHNKQGKLAEAEPLYQRAHDIWLRDLGETHPLVGLSLNNLGTLARMKGDYRAARAYFMRALAATPKVRGEYHTNAALTFNNLADIELQRGNYIDAEPWLQEAFVVLERAYGPEHPLLAPILGNLGLLHAKLGNPKRAVEFFEHALRFAERAGDSRGTAISLVNIAVIYDQNNQVDRAEPLFRRALSLFEASKSDGPELAGILMGLASVRTARGDHAEAVEMLERARVIASGIEGELGPNVARIDASLAHVAAERGRHADALALYARSMNALTTSYDEEHPDLAQIITNAAVLFWELGRGERAIEMMQAGMDLRERFVSRTLSGGSEEQRRLLLAASSQATDWAIGLHEHGFPGDERAKRLALLAALRSKGRVIEVMHETTRALREHLGVEERKLFDRLKGVRSKMARLAFADSGALRADQLRAELATLADEANLLESQLAARSPHFGSIARPVTIEDVAARIPKGSALVEFVNHQRFDPSGPSLRSWHERRYSAYVLQPNGSVSFADLGPAEPIDAAVASFREALRDRRSDPLPRARALDERVMRPVRRLLGKTRNLIVSADGSLNLVPFGALVDERQRYLIEDWSIRYLTTGRELLKPASGPARTASLVVADPAYDAAPSFAVRARAPAVPASPSRQRSAATGRFDALPGAQEEGWAVAERLGDAAVLSGSAASVGALLELKGPRILHLATHGFFLGDEKPVAQGHGIGAWGSAIPTGPVNPLLRSGLALAGANLGRAEDTGILTALEASSLDLWGTRLVVLSACDTGVGTVSNREGLYGLGRALSLAGAESVVASLWKVNDVAARDLMTAYYDALAQGGARAASLREVQLAMRQDARYAHPYYWASFVALGAEGPLGPTPKLPPALPALGVGARPPAAQKLGAARGCGCRVVAADRSGSASAVLALLVAVGLLVQRRSGTSSRLSAASPSPFRARRSFSPRSETRSSAAAAR